MTANNLTTTERHDVVTEMRQIHEEVAQLHHEMRQALISLSELVKEFASLKATDEATKEAVIGLADRLARDMTARPRPSPKLCPSCGAPLERHGADSGDLIICRSCGWSEFVDVNGVESYVHSDLPALGDVKPGYAWTRV